MVWHESEKREALAHDNRSSAPSTSAAWRPASKTSSSRSKRKSMSHDQSTRTWRTRQLILYDIGRSTRRY